VWLTVAVPAVVLPSSVPVCGTEVFASNVNLAGSAATSLFVSLTDTSTVTALVRGLISATVSVSASLSSRPSSASGSIVMT